MGDGSTAVNIAKISLVQLAGTCAKITIEQLSLYNFNCGALLVQVDEASRRQDVDHGLYHGPHFAIFSLPMTCHVRCGHASLYDMFIFRNKLVCQRNGHCVHIHEYLRVLAGTK